MIASSANCESAFLKVDRNEDVSPAIETTRCAHPGCKIYLCNAGCEHFSFQCDACGRRFCDAHRVMLSGLPHCLRCAVAAVESHEPECECTQTDVDLFDSRGCEFHDSRSHWNAQHRAVEAVQEYERYQKERLWVG